MFFSNLRNNILPSLGRGMGVGLLLLCVSCDHVDESEQFIYVQPAAIGRNVLIEDFTGQACINCPKATQEIHKLQDAYGQDAVVAVAIYSGDFGYIRGDRNRPYSLTTAMGDDYFTYWNLSSQPVGMVNRQSPSDYESWGTQVYTQMQDTALVQLLASAQFDTSDRTITITVNSTAQDGTVDGKLQLWLTEDSIMERQCMPEGDWNSAYLHNHVFRDAVNGQWGTDFHLDRGDNKSDTFTYTIAEDKDWKVENMHVVAFVYTSKGVEQVTTGKLNIEN